QADVLGIDVQVRDAPLVERFDPAQRLPEQVDAKPELEERAECRLVARVMTSPRPRSPEPGLDRPHGPPWARREDPALAPPPSQRVVQAEVHRLIEEDPILEEIHESQILQAGIRLAAALELARRAGRWVSPDRHAGHVVEMVGVVPTAGAVVFRG